MGVKAAHGYLKRGLLLPPTPSRTIPLTPSIINTDNRKGQQKYHEIQPSEIEEVIYNKNQYINKYFNAQHTGTIQSWGRDFVTEYVF